MKNSDMYRPSENQLRDQLASNLALLEPGLTLIETEFALPNPDGAGGQIDILARDQFSNRVIIELKRSEQTARTTIQQIHKYLALFRTEHQLPANRLRCLIVSTDWRELRVPFSEYVNNSVHQVRGLHLKLDQQGTIVAASRVAPIQLAPAAEFLHAHRVYLYASRANRDLCVAELTDKLSASSVSGFLLIELNPDNAPPHIRYPFGIYLVCTRFRHQIEQERRQEYRLEFELQPDEAIDPRSFDDYCLAELTESISIPYDAVEIGCPEKLNTVLQGGWSIGAVHRGGNVPSTDAASDEEIVRRILGLEGASLVYFSRITRADFGLDWASSVRGAWGPLKGNDSWEEAFKKFNEEIVTNYSEAIVSISIFNPMALPFSLSYAIVHGDTTRWPTMELIAHDEVENRLLLIIGEIRWDGRTHPDLSSVFADTKEELEEFLWEHALGTSWQRDRELMASHGLEYGTQYWEFIDGTLAKSGRWVLRNGSVVEDPQTADSTNLDSFVSENNDYIMKLHEYLEDLTEGEW